MKKESVFCRDCGRETRHDVRAEYQTQGEDENTNWETRYQVLQCAGCECVVFRNRFWFSEYQDVDDNARYVDEYFRSDRDELVPTWAVDLKEPLPRVLGEYHRAIEARCFALAAIGARTLLDLVLLDRVGDVGSFDKKLTALTDAGHVTPSEKAMLEVVTEAGNAAAHRGFAPEKHDLLVVGGIIERLLRKLYCDPGESSKLAESAELIRQRVPRREPPRNGG